MLGRRECAGSVTVREAAVRGREVVVGNGSAGRTAGAGSAVEVVLKLTGR